MQRRWLLPVIRRFWLGGASTPRPLQRWTTGTAVQSAFLCGHGCDEMQGYYFSAPVREAEIARMLRAGKKLR